MILVGELGLWVALLMAAWGAIVSFAGARADRGDLIASGVRALSTAFAGLVLATAGVLAALLSSEFSFRFVAAVTSANLPHGYKVAALWSGPAGSLLFCTLVVATCAARAVSWSRRRNAALVPYVAGFSAAILVVFVVTLCFVANPYERTVPTPVEGRGMHPALQHPGFPLHASLLYLGLSTASIPFALSVAALAARTADVPVILAIRKWSLVSWVLFTLAMIAGMWWAYVEVGDAGHWVLDPIRNLSMLPWLTTGALLYSSRRQERRGTVGRSTLMLAVTSFPLALLGAFIVRGGILSNDSAISWSAVAEWFTAFLAVAAAAVAYLVVTRRPRFTTPGPAVQGIPSRSRYGDYTLGLGSLLVVSGLAGSFFTKEADVALGSGETVTISDPFGDPHQFTSQGVSRFDLLNRHVTAVALQVTRESEPAGLITSEERQYSDSRDVHAFDPSTEAGIDYAFKQNVYVVLTGVTGDRAQMRIAFNPLVTWVWVGGAMIAIGGALGLWPASGHHG